MEYQKRALVVGGADVSAANPIPVNPYPGGKIVLTVLDEAEIAAATTTPLGSCDDIILGSTTLALTVEAQYDALAAVGIKIHVRTSPTAQAAGQHTGGMGVVLLTDENAHFGNDDELVGLTVHNVTDGSIGEITANTLTTITAVLDGGIENLWDTGDGYFITGADYDTEDWDVWDPAFAAGGFIRQTKVFEVDPGAVKVLVENLDGGVTVTDVKIIAAYGKW